MLALSTILLLAWGALAFGAEYSWAYAPLLVLAVTVATIGLRLARELPWPSRALAFALVAILGSAVLQLLPIPVATRSAVTPSGPAIDYGVLHAKAMMRPAPTLTNGAKALRPVSIAPRRTIVGITFLTTLVLLLIGMSRGFAAAGPQTVVRGVLILGVVVALALIVQHGFGGQKVYGFWYPPKGDDQVSAPFINRNHTAGWLAMALALSGGHLAACLARGMRGVKPRWRDRLLWLSSAAASEVVFSGFALFVMATAIVVTVSRSGFLCLTLTAALFCWWVVMRRQMTGSRRAIGATFTIVVFAIATTWGGIDAVLQRFQDSEHSALVRFGIWRDALHIAHDFPLTGTGLNTFGIAMLHYQTVREGLLFIEAHNDYLQLAAEGGLLLGIPILITIGLFVREVWRRFREGDDDTTTYWIRAGAVTGLCVIAVQETVEFTLQMPGAAVLFVVLAAIAIHKPAYLKESRADAPAS